MMYSNALMIRMGETEAQRAEVTWLKPQIKLMQEPR